MSEQRQTPVLAMEPSSDSSGGTSKTMSPTRTVRSQSIVEQDRSHNSVSNPSPTRPSVGGPASVPSAAAVQRALSAAKTSSNGNDTSPDAVKDRRQRSAQNTPHWPVSPRLKSPPPVSSRSISGRIADSEQSQSSASIRRLAPVSSMDSSTAMIVPQESSKESNATHSTLKPPGRGTSAPGISLETVDESSLPPTSSMSLTILNGEKSKAQTNGTPQNLDGTTDQSINRDSASVTGLDAASKPIERVESVPAARATSQSRAPTHLARRSLTSLTGKVKPAVEPLRTMTVETETVNSTPAIVTDRGRDGASLRTRPSFETIRPKKEKKRPSRKTPSLHAGTHSSKADIFEAKVASAVDEADSTDSDETFVYESNPPEPRHTRHHSRTPSATSVVSQMDQHGTRGKRGLRSNSTVVSGKKSMKFSNSIYGTQLDSEGPADGRGSTRTSSSTPRHHHINRHGRIGHPSIIDSNSPFTQANRATSPRTPTAISSRPSSPRTSNGQMHFSRKAAAAGYDAYEDGADDEERMPLMNSVRVNRNRHSRRPNSSHFRAMHFVEEDDPHCWPRFSGCFFLAGLIMLVCASITVFIVFLNRTLVGVEIERIQNVLASEQQIMLDLVVRATNPNIFPIVVQHLDVSIFAQSAYVGSALERDELLPLGRLSLTQRRQQASRHDPRTASWFPPFGADDGIDEGTDPIDDPDVDDPAWGNQKMLLGQIFSFDSALTFEPTPLNPHSSLSVGEIRLQRPGQIEIGGVARWERVLQHPFELIVRGVIKYQLPLSSSFRSAQIMDRIDVAPGGDSDDVDDGDDGDDKKGGGGKKDDRGNSTSPALTLHRP